MKTVKQVVIASRNPVKINAVQAAFKAAFPEGHFSFAGLSVPSGVPDQPLTDTETLQGALNRAENARQAAPDADFWTGLEGGLQEDADGQIEVLAWMVVLAANGRQGRARTATFYLPPGVTALVKSGMELGEADDVFFKQKNSRQKGGSVGLLTGGLVDRATYYQQAITLALIPFLNPEIYP